MITAQKLQDFTNACGHGYLKSWKAAGMAIDFPLILEQGGDKDRTLRWVKNCLMMEGFYDSDCEKVNDWLWENVNNEY